MRDFQRALEALLKEYPFEQLTIDQICEEAMLHRSSFYRYFHDKYDLLEQTISARLNHLICAANRNEGEFVETLIGYVDENRNIFRNLTTDSSHSSLGGETLKIVSEVLLKQRQDENCNDPVVTALRQSKHPEMLANVLSGSIIGAFHWWRENNYELPIKEVIDFTKGALNVLSDNLESVG